MKRDMDLIRAILLEVEGHSLSDRYKPIEVPGHSQEEVSYHIKLLCVAGLVEAMDCSTAADFNWVATSLTWDGHVFLDAARNETRWNNAKQLIKKRGVEVTIDTLKVVLAALARKALGL